MLWFFKTYTHKERQGRRKLCFCPKLIKNVSEDEVGVGGCLNHPLSDLHRINTAYVSRMALQLEDLTMCKWNRRDNRLAIKIFTCSALYLMWCWHP